MQVLKQHGWQLLCRTCNVGMGTEEPRPICAHTQAELLNPDFVALEKQLTPELFAVVLEFYESHGGHDLDTLPSDFGPEEVAA